MKKNKFLIISVSYFISFYLAYGQTQVDSDKSKSSTKSYREIKVVDHPTYPTYKNTGNPEEDQKRYQKEKAEWIEKNPREYEKMNNTTAPLSPEQEAEKRKKETIRKQETPNR